MRYFEQGDVGGVKEALEGGAMVAVPTETVYGVAVRYDDGAAVERLMRLKDRGVGSGKVFSLMVGSVAEMEEFVEMSGVARELAERYFPGELTLVLPKRGGFKNEYFDGFETVGVRIPKHEFMLKLLAESGPLIVTSANLRGEEPAVTGEAASELAVDVVVVGEAGGHRPSTVVRVVDGVEILRQGELSIDI